VSSRYRIFEVPCLRGAMSSRCHVFEVPYLWCTVSLVYRIFGVPYLWCTVSSRYRIFGVLCLRGLSHYNYVIYTHVGKYSDNIHIEK
jgi:hypothetical protein